MINIRAIIVDDELGGRNVLSAALKQYCPEISIVGIAQSKSEGKKLIEELRPELIFLDIEMPHGSGFDLLRELPVQNFEVIFVTGFDHYALKAIKFHALDYLLKPIDVQELKQAVNKVKRAFQKSRNTKRLEQLINNLSNPNQGAHKMAIPTASGKEFIAIQDIIRLEADGGCTWFHLKSGRKIISSKNLGEYEKILPDSNTQGEHHFIRIHKSHLINLFFIKIINNREHFVKMNGDTKIYIAQRRRTNFTSTLKKLNLL